MSLLDKDNAVPVVVIVSVGLVFAAISLSIAYSARLQTERCKVAIEAKATDAVVLAVCGDRVR